MPPGGFTKQSRAAAANALRLDAVLAIGLVGCDVSPPVLPREEGLRPGHASAQAGGWKGGCLEWVRVDATKEEANL